MDALLQWGLDIILAIQEFQDPLLDNLFRGITVSGNAALYVIAFPVIFWCMDLRLGVRLGVLFLLSGWCNNTLKDWWQQPRPFEFEATVQLFHARGYGLPSGHSQSAVVFWGLLAHWKPSVLKWGFAIVAIFLIGFSRIYLGVHFPTDVFAGWLIGAILLSLYLGMHESLEQIWASWNTRQQIAFALGVPLVLFLLHPVKNNAAAMGALAGLGVGMLLTSQFSDFRVDGTWMQRGQRILVGGLGLGLLYWGLRWIFPSGVTFVDQMTRWVRYASLGMWIGFAAPWLFSRLHLCSESNE